MKHNFRFSGTGGQGLITAGIILAEAAILDGKEAIQSQSYGPEARGGSSKAEAIISDDKIYFGRVTCPDVLLAMSQEAANKYTKDCGKDSIVITDSLFVTEVPGTYKERNPHGHRRLWQILIRQHRSVRGCCGLNPLRIRRSAGKSCPEPGPQRNGRSE